MKNEIIKIAKDLEQGTVTTEQARTLLLGLFDVSKRAFSYNQKVTYMGKQYYFKEQVENEILIANMETTNCPEMYNDWWVDSKYVC